MTVTVGINGFGRIGRNVLSAIVETGRTDIEVVAINDLGDVETNAHLLRYDSVHGRFGTEVKTGKSLIDVGGREIRVTSERALRDLDWEGVDIVLECTGVFTDRDQAAMHLEAGAQRVLVSAPSKGADKTIVYGVNHDVLTADDIVVSNASCTTNCLSPIAKILRETVGLKAGFMTTIHSYTGDQPMLDTLHKDLYRARAAAMSMIPTTTGAAKAVGVVLPDLDGVLKGVSLRVPTPNVSVVDLCFVPEVATDAESINQLMLDAVAKDPALAGIMAVTDEKLVSTDFNHRPESAIFATDQTYVVGGALGRVLVWYDNEWGFSNRMADTAVQMGRFL